MRTINDAVNLVRNKLDNPAKRTHHNPEPRNTPTVVTVAQVYVEAPVKRPKDVKITAKARMVTGLVMVRKKVDTIARKPLVLRSSTPFIDEGLVKNVLTPKYNK